MTGADVLAGMRKRFPAWTVSVERGMWRASERRLIWASSPELLEVLMNGENPFPEGLAARRIRVRAKQGG
jgi:hypothetical protein